VKTREGVGGPRDMENAAQYGQGKLPGTLGDNGDASYTCTLYDGAAIQQ